MTARAGVAGVRAGYEGRPDVLRGVDLEARAGRVVALLGENGSGKSTLLKVLAGVVAVRSGEVRLDGRPRSAIPRREAARLVGYLPQGFTPLFPMRALDLVVLGRTPRFGAFGGPEPADVVAAEDALREVDGASLAGTDILEMSGGERQRVLLARVLAGEPEILLLDEPTANLDPRHRFLVLAAMRRRAALGGTVLFSTHEVDVAAAGADDAALLSDGALLAAGPVGETLTAPLLTTLFRVAARVVTLPDGRPQVSLEASPASSTGC